MNSVKFDLFVVLSVWITMTGLAQTNLLLHQPDTNSSATMIAIGLGSSTTTRSDAPVDWPQLLQQQAKIFETTLEAQRDLSVATISSVKNSNEHLISLAHLVCIVVTVLIAIFGAWVWTQVNTVRKLPKEAATRMKAVESKLHDIEGKFQGFDTIFAAANTKLTKLQIEVEEALEDIRLRTEIAKRRIELMSASHEERLRAVQALGQIQSPLAIPVLQETLRDLNRPPEILAEAIYGLGRRGQELVQDMNVIALLTTASRHHHKMVRLASVNAMRRIDPHNATFKTRLTEMSNYDEDGDVKSAARHILEDSGA